MATVTRLATTISAHAWNADRSLLAVCPNSSDVWIYANCRDPDVANWEKRWVLTGQHHQVVCGIDWHPVTNRIVTCSHDRAAFVWNQVASGAWEPQVTMLSHQRACLDVKWSPDGKKFAVASGSKYVMIAIFDEINNWWVARNSVKHKSTVTSLAWHPNSQLLATGSTDYRCRIVSAYIEDVDGPADASQFGPLPDAGEVISEFMLTKAWVNDVAWSPSGRVLAFAAHDSLLHLVTFMGPGQDAPIQTFKAPTLPATRLLFLSERALVTVGHSMNPELYAQASGGIWAFAGNLDRKPEAAAAAKATSGVAAARAMFASKVSKGTSGGAGGAGGESELWTKHQNAITAVKPYAAAATGAIGAFSTSGNDGRVVIWPIASLGIPDLNLQALGIA